MRTKTFNFSRNYNYQISILIQGFKYKNTKCAAMMDRMIFQTYFFVYTACTLQMSADICRRGVITGTDHSLCEKEMAIQECLGM